MSVGATAVAKGAAKAPLTTVARFAWPLAAVRSARAVHTQWNDRLTPRQRKQALALLRASHGRPSRLSARQRRQLRNILAALGPVDLAWNAAVAAAPLPSAPKRKLFRRS